MRIAALVAVICILQGCKLPQRKSADAGAPPFAAPAAHAPVTKPAGYVSASVIDVIETRSGDAVLLADETGNTVLPIFVGGTEAMTIKLRMEGKHYKRPLTHDLLSDMMKDLGGTALKVQVDDLRNDTFIGSAFIEKSDGTVVELDARPSDCIAMALGEKVPIYVKQRVFDSAGIDKSEIEGDGEDKPKPQKHKRGEPLSL